MSLAQPVETECTCYLTFFNLPRPATAATATATATATTTATA